MVNPYTKPACLPIKFRLSLICNERRASFALEFLTSMPEW